LIHLTTYFSLPPGIPTGSVIRQLLRRIFEEYGWFQPVKYGRASLPGRLDPGHIDFDALEALYERYHDITVTARTDRDFLVIFPSKWEYPYTGRITWATSAAEAKKPSWREAHLRQVHEIMKLLGAPLAWTGLDTDLEGKQLRRVPDPNGLSATETHTVRDYSEGLAGVFWRNFFGSPFVRMFGERLATLPSEFKQDLGEGIVLVQPYELPGQAGTPGGIESERQIITHLGPECFYDHERQLKPTRRPELTFSE
jgi:hypothetical protein